LHLTRPASCRAGSASTATAQRPSSGGGGSGAATGARGGGGCVGPGASAEEQRLPDAAVLGMGVLSGLASAAPEPFAGGSPSAVAGAGACDRTKLMMRLHTTCNPEDLEQCEDGCYWRWLVHTLLEDVSGLKLSLDETREELAARATARRKTEQAVANRDRLATDIVEMSEALNSLRESVPTLRADRTKLQSEVTELRAEETSLQERKRDLQRQLAASAAREREMELRVQKAEGDVEDVRRAEKALGERIVLFREEDQQLDVDMKSIGTELDRLRLEVQGLEDARGGGRKGSGSTARGVRAKAKPRR